MVEPEVAARRKILFVDDERSVRDAVRALLRKYCAQWDMEFTGGGRDALALLAAAPFDVLVTDLSMPGMDGAQLLAVVRERHPSVTRILLTGAAERSGAERAIAVAHQYLTKPFSPPLLRQVVERVCGVRRLVEDEAIRSVVGRLGPLPSLPQAYLELMTAFERPHCTLGELAAIVERDPAMTAKILQLVNSLYFGVPRTISAIADAVSYLGSDLLRSLALSAHLFAKLHTASVGGFSAEELQDRAILGSKLARALLADHGAQAAEAFSAALLRDLGALVLAVGLPGELDAVIARHAEVGGYLLGTWGLPVTIVEAVTHHHHPSRITHDDCDVVAAVHVAGTFADAAITGAPLDLDPALAATVGPRLAEWKTKLHAELAGAGLGVEEP